MIFVGQVCQSADRLNSQQKRRVGKQSNPGSWNYPGRDVLQATD